MKRAIDELQGEVVETVLGLQQSERTGPEMLLLHLRASGWRYGFLEWSQTWLEPIDGEDRAWMMEETYAGATRVDYAARFGLVGAVVVRIEVSTACDPDHDPESITIVLDRGTLTMTQVDPSDFDSDARVAWTPVTS